MTHQWRPAACAALTLILVCLAGRPALADTGASKALSVFGRIVWGMAPEQLLQAFPDRHFDKPVEGSGFITLSHADTYDQEPVQVTFIVMTHGQGLAQCDIRFLKDSATAAARFDAYAREMRERLGSEDADTADAGGKSMLWRNAKAFIELQLGPQGGLSFHARSPIEPTPTAPSLTP